jgi:hypothetical protein
VGRSTDLEALEIIVSILEVGVDILDRGVLGSLFAPADHLPDPIGGAFENGFDPSVGQVLDPSGQVQFLGLLPRRVAEEDALDLAGNTHMRAFLVFALHCSHLRRELLIVTR